MFSLRLQNIFLLVSSYFFYGYWDWRFLSLIAISTIIDYFTGLKIEQANKEKSEKSHKNAKKWLLVSIITNLSILGFFKYFNFFIDSLAAILISSGINPDGLYLNIILPVGISFYTFQTMSYSIDVYRGEMKPTRDFIGFAVYVSFFPQLVAGPIERAKKLLPEIINKRTFNLDQFYEGLHLILLGLFKKVYVADNLAPYVDNIFSSNSYTGSEVIAGAYLFAFQVYCDFSGYSDIARGCAKCLGIELMVNFNYPFVAINPNDLWRRWHISLSSWLADYLYIPLGGNRKGTVKTYRNLFITMLLGGLWHGAAWNFVLWGAFHGILLVIYKAVRTIYGNYTQIGTFINSKIKYLFKMVLMFQFFCLALVIFRSQSPNHAIDMFVALFTWRGGTDFNLFLPLLQFAGPLVAFEIFYYLITNDIWDNFQKIPVWIRTVSYAIIFYLISFYGASAESFIYFQF